MQAQPTEANPARYDLNGKVVAVDKSAKRLTVDHGDIPGFMGAMTMPYAVKDEHLLDNLKAGDQISAKVVSTGSEFWLENIAVKPGAPGK
jgi:protein SCO1/2